MIKRKKREEWIDFAKCFACILVVIGHLLQGLKMANIEWYPILYEYINKFIYIFHMPLFMCLSGYLYGKYTQINSFKEYINFIKKKFLNLGIPYFIFYISHVLINMLFSSSVNSPKNLQDILNILTNPIPPFWFLYALFCIFIIIPIIERIFKNNNVTICFVLTILHIINIFFKTNIYAIDVCFELAIYFYLGIIILNYKLPKWNIKSLILNSIIFIGIGLIYCYLTLNINVNTLYIFKLILAVYATIICIVFHKNYEEKISQQKYYVEISKYTFPIYLMHTIFSAGIRIFLLKVNITNFYIHLLLGFTAGIIMPIIIAKILAKTVYGNIILYPTNTLQQIQRKRGNK